MEVLILNNLQVNIIFMGSSRLQGLKKEKRQQGCRTPQYYLNNNLSY